MRQDGPRQITFGLGRKVVNGFGSRQWGALLPRVGRVRADRLYRLVSPR